MTPPTRLLRVDKSRHKPKPQNSITLMASEKVPQDLVAMVLMAFTCKKPILVSSNLNLGHTESHLTNLMKHMTTSWNADHSVIECRNETTLDHLKEIFVKQPENSGIILRRYDTLAPNVLTELESQLLSSHSEVRKYLEHSCLIFTSSRHIQQLDHRIRRHFLLLLEHNIGDGDVVNVEISKHAKITQDGIASIRSAAEQVTIVPELFGYIQDILVFVRSHRFVNCGITPHSSNNFENVVRALCVLRGLKFAPPMIIKEAALLTLPVQIKMLAFDEEPSLEYGGDLREARIIRNLLSEHLIVQQVLKEVPVPK